MSAASVIAIVGDGIAAWMTAATLARRLPSERYEIVVVDPGPVSPECFGPAMTSLPSLAGFHAMLGLEEAAFVWGAHGSVALGAAFAGWSASGGASFFPFGEVGAPMGSVAFHQLAARLALAGQEVNFANYATAALAAQAGRFGGPGQPHGLHLETQGYRGIMRTIALRLGARRATALLVETVTEDGRIAQLRLSDEMIVPALVIDCSGPERRAIGALAPRFRSWKAWLPCDRMAGGISAESVAPLYGQVLAEDAGWTSLTPLSGGTASLRCFSADFESEEGERFENGRLDTAWIGNCVAIGTAAAIAEPLHPVGLHLIQSALARLLTLLPATSDMRVEAAEYNRITANELDGVRDFLALQYATTTRPGPFWDAVRASSLPERTDYKRALFEATGRIVMYDDEMFDVEDWVTLFDAQGIRPRRYDALADGFSLREIEQHFARLRDEVVAKVRTMPVYTGSAA